MLAPALPLVSCSSEELPFTYFYLSRDTVDTGFQGKSYLLQQGERRPAPFAYAFEPDGDMDITIDGKSYEIDSSL